MNKNVILKIEDLSKSFEKQQVLSELNLEMSEGEFLTLLGPSGCGKTTLLNCIAGFVRPDKGSIYLRGKKVNDVKTKDRNLSMVFQSWALFPHMNVFDNIAFGLRMKGFTKKDIEKKVKKSLDLIKLSDISHKYPSQLSGGMQQRVALARAIVVESDIVLFDEPLSNLDARLRKQMQVELKNIHKDLGMTMLYVTHDQEEALTMSDQICVMCEGRILRKGSPMEVYDDPQYKFACNFLGEANIFKGKVKKLLDKKDVVLETTEGIKLELASQDFSVAVDQEILVALRPEKININPTASRDIDNSFQASVKNIVYQGKSMIFYLDLNGKEIIAFGKPDYSIVKDQEVYVEFKPSDLSVLKNEE